MSEERKMKGIWTQVVLGALLFGVAACTFRAAAQTSDETLTWLRQFIATNGGDVNRTFAPWGVKGTDDKALFYEDITKVEVWGYKVNSNHFVRISGQVHDCAGAPGGTDFVLCAKVAGFMDVETRTGNDKESQQRIANAITHLAELAGAHPNGKEPF